MTTFRTLAFDAYGTLFDTTSVDRALEQYVGERALEFAYHWRQKQLEFSFRRGLMRKYVPFNVCTADALRYVSYLYELDLQEADIEALLAEYRRLSCYADVVPALSTLKAAGHQIMILSNGHPDDLQELVQRNELESYFEDIVSVHEIESFKPNPDVYKLFIERSQATKENAWLISGNTFDFVGAISFGMKGALVQRDNNRMIDSWEVDPTVTIASLNELADMLDESAS